MLAATENFGILLITEWKETPYKKSPFTNYAKKPWEIWTKMANCNVHIKKPKQNYQRAAINFNRTKDCYIIHVRNNATTIMQL